MVEIQAHSICPITYDHLDIDHLQNQPHSVLAITDKNVCVYPNCGHVYSSAANNNPNKRNCPMCRKQGPLVPLRYRFNPVLSDGKATHVLSCGHAVTEECAKMAMNRKILDEKDFPMEGPWRYEGKSNCPFCKTKVTGYKKLHLY
jgi:hypothetical protein